MGLTYYFLGMPELYRIFYVLFQAKNCQPCHTVARAVVQVQLGRLWSGVNTKETLENIVGQLATAKGLECDFKRFLIQLSYVAVRFDHYLFLLHFYCRPLEAIKMRPVCNKRQLKH